MQLVIKTWVRQLQCWMQHDWLVLHCHVLWKGRSALHNIICHVPVCRGADWPLFWTFLSLESSLWMQLLWSDRMQYSWLPEKEADCIIRNVIKIPCPISYCYPSCDMLRQMSEFCFTSFDHMVVKRPVHIMSMSPACQSPMLVCALFSTTIFSWFMLTKPAETKITILARFSCKSNTLSIPKYQDLMPNCKCTICTDIFTTWTTELKCMILFL